MALNEAITFLLIGGGAGILAGMFGIGGGILIVPAIVVFSGMNLKEAYGTSLAALLLPVGIFGCIVYYREKLLDFKAAGAVALGIIVTVGIGAYLANILELNVLKICYSLFLFYMGFKYIKPFIIRKSKKRAASPGNAPSDLARASEASNSSYLDCFIIGLIAGIVSGFFGVGGGAIIVPLLTSWLKFPTKKAIATSLGVLLPPIGLPGVLVYYAAGNLNFSVAFIVALGLLLGTIFGARLTIKLPAGLIKAAYGVLLIVTGIKFSLNIII